MVGAHTRGGPFTWPGQPAAFSGIPRIAPENPMPLADYETTEGWGRDQVILDLILPIQGRRSGWTPLAIHDPYSKPHSSAGRRTP